MTEISNAPATTLQPLSRRTVLQGGVASLSLGLTVGLAGCATPTSSSPEVRAFPPSDPWVGMDEVLRSIAAPNIPSSLVRAADFDLPASGTGDARPAIQAAIEAASEQGGGRVSVPVGLWLTDGPIHLRSKIDLHLEEGCEIKFLPTVENYLPPVLTRWEGTDVYTYSPMVYAEDCEDVALTGPGRLNGQGEEHWLPWRKTQNPIKKILRDMGRDGVPVEERVFVGERRLRPYFVQFNRCKRILVDGPELVDSPFWMVHLLYSEDATVRNIRCKSDHVNSDGVDPDSSRRVLIEDCDFDVGDDGVSLKSGRDQDGWRVGRPTEDIVVRNCRYSGQTGGGMAIGSEMSGGVRNVYVDGFDLPLAKHTLYFKANLDRGGLIEDVFIRNIRAGETQSLLVFTNDYHSYRGGTYPPSFERVLVENVSVEKTGVGISIDGHETAPVRDVTIRNLSMGTAEFPLKVSNAERITMDAVTHNGLALTLADATPVDNEKLGGH